MVLVPAFPLGCLKRRARLLLLPPETHQATLLPPEPRAAVVEVDLFLGVLQGDALFLSDRGAVQVFILRDERWQAPPLPPTQRVAHRQAAGIYG